MKRLLCRLRGHRWKPMYSACRRCGAPMIDAARIRETLRDAKPIRLDPDLIIPLKDDEP